MPLLVAACVLGMLGLPRELAAQTWTLTGSTSSIVVDSTVTLLSSGKVLAAGGMGQATVAELFDPATGK